MSRPRFGRPRGFTLVELLVVLGIIAMLMALLTPAVMWGVNAARRARQGTEIAALQDSIEKYKTAVGDYPPNFRDYNAFIRHVRTRYQKINPAHLNAFVAVVWPGYDLSNPPPATAIPMIDEGESLVFWLALTRNDPIYPFGPAPFGASGGNAEFKTFYEFDSKRISLATNTALIGDGDQFPSYLAAYAKDTYYLYIDSRSYDELGSPAAFAAGAYTGAFAEVDTSSAAAISAIQHDQVTRPYGNDSLSPMNATSFQILCAGQDGDWGNVDPLNGPATAIKGFPGGLNYTAADRDNITNFSEGRTLEDHIP